MGPWVVYMQILPTFQPIRRDPCTFVFLKRVGVLTGPWPRSRSYEQINRTLKSILQQLNREVKSLIHLNACYIFIKLDVIHSSVVNSPLFYKLYTLLGLTLLFYILLFSRDPPQLKVIFRMPHGMTEWMGPFYKPQGEGVSITRYQPPGIKSTSILEEGISSRHNSQISPLITGKVTKYIGTHCGNPAGLWIEGVWDWALAVFFDVFVKLGRDPSFPLLLWWRKREKKLRGFYFWDRSSINGTKYFVVSDSCRSFLLRMLKIHELLL